jgi:hypothetical protein
MRVPELFLQNLGDDCSFLAVTYGWAFYFRAVSQQRNVTPHRDTRRSKGRQPHRRDPIHGTFHDHSFACMVTVVSVSRTVRQVVDRFVPPSSRPTPVARPRWWFPEGAATRTGLPATATSPTDRREQVGSMDQAVAPPTGASQC